MRIRFSITSLVLALSVCTAEAQTLPRLMLAPNVMPWQSSWILAWDPSPDPTVTAYRAYCGPSSGTYSAPVTVTGTSYQIPFSGTFYCRVASLAGTLEGPRSIELGIVNNVPVPPVVTPPPPPPPPDESPEGTKVPPASGITRADGVLYAMGAPIAGNPGNFRVTRNGQDTSGWGQYLVYRNHGVYLFGADNSCYSINAAGAFTNLKSPQPCEELAPPPPPPPPPPPTPVLGPAPTITTLRCDVELKADKPANATGTGWRVQYFNGTTAITSISSTVRRVVELPLGAHSITAQWTKAGQPTITTGVSTKVCQ